MSTLDWSRPDLEHFVYVYRKDDPQMEQYANRMRVDHRGLQWGNLSLFIPSVGPSDSGPYRSFIPQYSTVQLNVGENTELKKHHSQVCVVKDQCCTLFGHLQQGCNSRVFFCHQYIFKYILIWWD